MSKSKKKDVAERAIKTFIEAFGSTAIAMITDSCTTDVLCDVDALKKFGIAVTIAGLSAGLSALLNMFKKECDIDG